MPELIHMFLELADWLVYFARCVAYIAMTPITEIFSGRVGFSFLPVFTDIDFPSVILYGNWFLDTSLDIIQEFVGFEHPLTVLEFTLYLSVLTFVLTVVNTIANRIVNK